MPEIPREAFLRTLEAVQPGLDPTGAIEQSSCFIFKDGAVMTFNDEVSCRMDLSLKDGDDVFLDIE